MLHRIALFSDSATLNLVYLDQNGAPHAFTQNAVGVWANATAPGPISPNVTFNRLLGLSNVLFALDQNGKIWSISHDANGNWDTAGFQALPNPAGIIFNDLGIAPMPSLGGVLLVGGTEGSPYAQSGPLQGPLTDPTEVDPVLGPSIAVAAIPNPSGGGAPTAVVLAGTGFVEIYATSGGYSTDGVNWQSATIPQTVVNPVVAAIGTGNGGTLQAIILSASLTSNGSLPSLLFDTSGNGSAWASFGTLPNPNSIPFSQVAVANGNGGNLQVVGLGANDGLPYLIWQDNLTGAWSAYAFGVGQGGMQLPYNGPPIVDLAMGVGGPGSQGFLQVGCIGTDGNIYVNYQDLGGTWRSYGPLPSMSVLSTTVAAGSNNQPLGSSPSIFVASVAGFPSPGVLYIQNSAFDMQIIQHTGTSTVGGDHFAGCTGGTGTILEGAMVLQAMWTTASGGQTLPLGSGALMAANPQAAGFPSTGGLLWVQTTAGFQPANSPSGTGLFAGFQPVKYAATTTTSFTGCSASGIGATASPYLVVLGLQTTTTAVQSLPTATLNVASTAAFPSTGSLNVETGSGMQLVNYSGTTSTSFTGHLLGSGLTLTEGLVTGPAFAETPFVVQSLAELRSLPFNAPNEVTVLGANAPGDGGGARSTGTPRLLPQATSTTTWES